MKIVGLFIAGVSVISFWMMYSGYQHVSIVKNFGREEYVLAEEDDNVISSSTNITLNKKSNIVTATATPVRVVTHIKTPENVKSVYMSSWVAGTPSIRAKMVKLIDETELNAIVIDVKDNTGVVSWDGRIRDLEDFIDELHSKNIYVIARISAFQDPIYVKQYPDEAVHSKKTGGIWKDHKGIPWVDTGSKKMWKYVEDLSKESYARGFDEVNLDYIRFPTDGALSDMTFPISGKGGVFVNKPAIIGEFYRYITDSLRKDGIPVSGDLFGIIMVTKADIAVLGQDMHVALQTFDYVAPMIYPSHFYAGTAGYQKPALYPGEIISYSMNLGLKIADEVASSTGQATSTIRAKYRPWYQDFDMGATYTAEMVRAQIDAGEKIGIKSWMLWDPANKYTQSALKK
ncbi:putative glycoside hydrolase [Candidatus Gracilibacteria bacterium]|nr:putative glycoside hydrolase [Candidatus Gracilibacteria bacterium]MCF7898925.1 putative glycoside hydrolase [Candidatus Paceibacterota bacterium]